MQTSIQIFKDSQVNLGSCEHHMCAELKFSLKTILDSCSTGSVAGSGRSRGQRAMDPNSDKFLKNTCHQMAFFGIQIIQNSISTMAPTWTPLAEFTTLSHASRRLWPNSLLPRCSVSLSTPKASRLGAYGTEKLSFWIRPWCLGSLVVRVSDLQLSGREFDSPAAALSVGWYWDVWVVGKTVIPLTVPS